MGVDGLMSDQLFIEQNSQLVTDILLQVQEETIEQLYKLKGQRKANEFKKLTTETRITLSYNVQYFT